MENKNLAIWVAIILVFIGGLWYWYKSSGSLSNSQPVESVEGTSAGVNAGAKGTSLSYKDALIKYADKRIQFDQACQAVPNNVTYKDNTGIMLDNRSPQARTIKIGTNYTVKGYGFKIVFLPDVYLKAKTILVNCDKSKNVATILVQE